MSINTLLTNNVVCQQRTTRAKQYVIMSFNENNPEIVKGPYKKEKLDRLMNNSDWLESWRAPLVVLPNGGEVTFDDQLFTGFPNLNRGRPIACSTFGDKTTEVEYERLDRTNLVKLGDSIGESWMTDFFPDIVLSLSYLYILGVGDTGMANILADLEEKQIYVIDFEERRGSWREDELFYFTGRPAKKKADLFLPHVLPYYNYIADLLEELNVDESMEERRESAVRMLREYGRGDEIFTPRPPLTWNLTREEIDAGVDEILDAGIEEEEEEDLSGTGYMEERGVWNAITYSGFPIDEMKSAIQKYIRRGITDKALMATFEMYRMSEIGATRWVSNMYNRLAVIAAEDIGPANLPLVSKVISLCLSKNLSPSMLISVVTEMCESKKTRVGSHIYQAYFRSSGMAMATDMGIDINDRFTRKDKKTNNVEWVDEDNRDLKLYLEALNNREDITAFIWLRYYQEVAGEWRQDGKKGKPIKLKRMNRRTDYMAPLIKAITNGHESVKNAYWELSEKRPFLVLLMLAKIYNLPHEEYDIEPSEDEDLERRLLTGNYDLELDEYVIDMHTSRGKRSGKDRDYFTLVSSKVENESEKYKLCDYEYIYTHTSN